MYRSICRRLAFIAATGFSLVSLSAFADTITLTGTLRDFAYGGPAGALGLSAHPDFEAPVSGLTTGMVQNTLGADGKPVFIGGGSVTSAATFGQWYRDVAGVNASKSYSINLTAGAGGVYTYSNSAFFPIDNDLNGNQGLDHNFHFTYELAGTFGYTAGLNQTFAFSGDDDVWVFLNGKLAIDLGGIHGATSQSVNLDTVAASLGLVDKNNYAFNMFYAERHTSESNFRIDTSLPLEVVPEPSTYAAMMAGLAFVGFMGYRRRNVMTAR